MQVVFFPRLSEDGTLRRSGRSSCGDTGTLRLCDVYVIVSKGTEGEPELFRVEGVYGTRETAEHDLDIYLSKVFEDEDFWIQKTILILG